MISRSQQLLLMVMIVLAMPLSGASIDIHAPSLPHIVTFFHATQQLGQWSVSVYLLGFSLGAFLVGLISDYTPYRTMMLMMTLLFSLSCLCSTWAPNIHCFLLTRFFQGLLVAGPNVYVKGYVGKLFSGPALRRVSSSITLSWSAGLVLAPVLGGYLQHFFHWQACFYFLAGYSLLIVVCAWLSSYKNDRKIFSGARDQFKKDVKAILGCRLFIGATLCVTTTYSIISVYNTVAPFILQHELHLTSRDYGHVGMLLGCSWLIGNMTNRYLIHFFSSKVILGSGLVAYFLMTLLSIFLLKNVSLSVVAVIVPMVFIYFIGGLLLSYGISMTMGAFPGLEGMVTALRCLVMLLMTSLLTILSSFLPVDSQIPLLAMYCLMSTVGIISFFVFLKRAP